MILFNYRDFGCLAVSFRGCIGVSSKMFSAYLGKIHENTPDLYPTSCSMITLGDSSWKPSCLGSMLNLGSVFSFWGSDILGAMVPFRCGGITFVILNPLDPWSDWGNHFISQLTVFGETSKTYFSYNCLESKNFL